MTAREQLARAIVKILRVGNFEEQLVSILSHFRIQMKKQHRDRLSGGGATARDEALRVLCEKRKEKRWFNVVDALDLFKIQVRGSKEYGRSPKIGRHSCNVVSMAEYKDNLIPVSYGYVAGGPVRKTGSQKVCPKCNSMGLHLAKGYKERYYSCVYCGFRKELEAETYQWMRH